jgi:hypothetical protein
MYFRSIRPASAEYAVMGARFIIFGVMSLITGQLEATHAMFCSGASLHGCHLITSRRPAPEPATG